MNMLKNVLVIIICSAILASLNAQIGAKLIQYPDVSEDKICFTFGDDLWMVPKEGGDAYRIISPTGRETTPKFSPDGRSIAYVANYDGNNDIYTLSIKGGVPHRVTGHGMFESLQDWSADGESLLYASSAESDKQRWAQFYSIDKQGGLPTKLPVELGANASVSADGTMIAFTDKSRVNRNWKRYRGGTAPDITIMNLLTLDSENITQNDANDEVPMWQGNLLYYLSDKDQNMRNNIWVYDVKTKTHKQLTFFEDYDVHYPSIGPSDLVYEAGGEIYLMDLKTKVSNMVTINAVGDFTRIRPVSKKVGEYASFFDLSPDGNRAVIEARGELFTLPKEKGFVKNFSATSEYAERFPAWSPDGKYIAYFSDQSGEYELTLKDLKNGTERKISELGPGYRYNIFWSPDSQKVVYVDHSMTFYVHDISSGVSTKIDQESDLFEGGLRSFRVSWSADSQWIGYVNSVDNGNNAIYIYNTNTNKKHQVTSGYYNDNDVVFDKEGDYLYVLTDRNLSPLYSDFDNSWVYPNATQLAAIALRKDVSSILAATNDIVEIDDETSDPKDQPKKKKGLFKKKDKEDRDENKEEDGDKVTPVVIDFDNIERRLEVLTTLGNAYGLSSSDGKIIYLDFPNSGSDEELSILKYYDVKKQESKTILSDVDEYKINEKGTHVVVKSGSQYGIIEVGEDQKMEHTLALDEMVAQVVPQQEWNQIFNDVWRFERDFFYDEDMHGVDWDAMKIKYGSLVSQAMSRWDVNYLIGELIGELNASHTYKGGGDSDSPKRKNVGYLGVDWEEVNGHFKIKKIIRGAKWDSEVRSPLDHPGIAVNEGDYVLAVNGIPMSNYKDPWIALTGMAGKTVELTVNASPNMANAKSILVKPLRSETRLRNLSWIEENRQVVDKMSDGKIGYIYVPSTGLDGQEELIRMFYAQWNKEGLIIDERFNNGGQIPDRFIELLNRKPLAYFDVRDGKNWQWPPVAHFGPKAMLINGWSGSGGDAFPDYFRKSGLGPLIGTRTWGGVIGISGAPSLIDGGRVTVPTFRMYDPQGKWFAEGHGVEPDIAVGEDHSALAKGQDVQLETAIKNVLEQLKERGPIHPKTPMQEKR